ncbi:hypothetical protein ACFWG5_33155 [Streptomyces hydrogenans]|uniref:hypothetical protein n=1 Tax=Streptomyces hydrogenans TaxID=1873719 RepID=UPI003652CA9A
MDVVADLPADPQVAAPVQVDKGALDNPALGAESGAVFGAASSDQRLHAGRADEATVLVVVVAAVGQQHVRSSSGAADQTGDSRDLGEQDSSWVTSLRFPPVSDTASGMPCPPTRT